MTEDHHASKANPGCGDSSGLISPRDGAGFTDVTETSHPTVAGAPVVVRPFADLSWKSIGSLAELEQRVHESSAYYDDSAWQEEQFSKELPGKRTLSRVASVNEQLVGFLVASRRPNGVHVHRLAVHPDHQGRGVASALLAHLLADAVGIVTINCDPRNASALGLYERAGFKRTEMTKEGKWLLATDRLPTFEELRLWYLFTSTGMDTGHAAHLPRLIEALSRTSLATAVRYGERGDLPPMRPTPGWGHAFFRLLLRAKREGVDVIFVRIHWPIASLLWLAGRLWGGWKVALWSSGGQGFLAESRQTPRQRAVRLIHRFVLRRCVDALVTGPPSVLDEYISRYHLRPDRMLLASNDVGVAAWNSDDAAPAAETGIEIEQQPNLSQWLSAPNRFIYVHGLDSIRGADRLPELLTAVRRELSGAELLVLGDGPLYEQLTSEPLRTIGRVSNQGVAWCMSKAHCLLVPSRQEGFPRVLLEAMAQGLPSVAFDVGGCRDVLGEFADESVAVDGSLEQMATLAVAAALRRAKEGPQTRLIERARIFDTDPVAFALAATLRSLVAQGAAPASWLSRSLWLPAFQERKS